MSIKGYKGFDKNLKCRGFQFKAGGEYEEQKAEVCEKGFHFCEYPIDVFSYYPPADSRYCEVEGDGQTDKRGGDSKVACTKLRVGVEIGLKGMIEAGVKFVLDKVDWTNNKETNTGDQSAATNTGDQSAATNTGDQSAATNTGYRSAATVEGKESVAMATGYKSKAKGALGCWIVLAEWARDEEYDWHIVDVQCVNVDGDKIKADTYYSLVNSEFVEVAKQNHA